MNALGSSVMGDDDVPHGTSAGFTAGCRGSSCPMAPSGLSCSTAHRRYAGDYGFRKLVDAGRTPAEIVALEGGAVVEPVRPKPKPRPRQKRAQDLGSVRVPVVAEKPQLQTPETWRISEGPAFEVAEKVEPDVETLTIDVDTSKWDAAAEQIERVARRAFVEDAPIVVGEQRRDPAESAEVVPTRCVEEISASTRNASLMYRCELDAGHGEDFHLSHYRNGKPLRWAVAEPPESDGTVWDAVQAISRAVQTMAADIAAPFVGELSKSDVALVPTLNTVADVPQGTAVPTDSPIRPVLSPRPFQGGSGAHSVAEVSQREAAAELAKLGARRMAAWDEIEAVREPSNVLVIRLVGLGMTQAEVAELAGISQASVAALVKGTRKGGRK